MCLQGLTSCADTFIGSSHNGIKGVSGGEKRRTSVGVELITSPTCLFLDEPTSGLDSEIAVSIMRTLKSVAAKSRTVLLTIHQPNSDITELFDHFILMAKGQIVYGGGPLCVFMLATDVVGSCGMTSSNLVCRGSMYG